MRKKCESSCQMLWGRCNPRCASHFDCSVCYNMWFPLTLDIYHLIKFRNNLKSFKYTINHVLFTVTGKLWKLVEESNEVLAVNLEELLRCDCTDAQMMILKIIWLKIWLQKCCCGGVIGLRKFHVVRLGSHGVFVSLQTFWIKAEESCAVWPICCLY